MVLAASDDALTLVKIRGRRKTKKVKIPSEAPKSPVSHRKGKGKGKKAVFKLKGKVNASGESGSAKDGSAEGLRHGKAKKRLKSHYGSHEEEQQEEESGKGHRQQEASRLELLPPELLQQIFLYCLNFNLPQASSRIASKLSNEHLFRSVARIAFLSKPAMPKLKNDVLRSRWVTEARWRVVEDECCRAITLRRRRELKLDDQLESDNRKWALRQLLGRDLSHTAFLSDAELPVRLLHAPWTLEKVTLLTRLTRLGAHVDWTTTTAGETAEQGLKSAIHEGRADIVRLLTSAAVGVPVHLEQLRMAVINAGCDKPVVLALRRECRASHQEVQSDPELLRWAEHAIRDGHDLGHWLLDVLRCRLGIFTSYKKATKIF